MDEIKKYIGEKIRHERLRRDMSVEQLAEILNVSPSYIGLIERGQRGTNVKLLLKICELFNTSVDEFLSDKKMLLKEEPAPDPCRVKIYAIDNLLRTLNANELEFVISTIKNLRSLRENLSGTKNNSDNDEECFY